MRLPPARKKTARMGPQPLAPEHSKPRVRAHVIVAFLGYGLWVTLKQRSKRHRDPIAAGLRFETPRQIRASSLCSALEAGLKQGASQGADFLQGPTANEWQTGIKLLPHDRPKNRSCRYGRVLCFRGTAG
jgi:hypothetical protein